MLEKVNKKTEEKDVDEKNPIIQKANTRIFINVLTAIFIMTYFVGIYIAFNVLQSDVFERVLQVLTMVLLAITIIVFEIAYKKDSGLLAISGIEALIVSCHALAIPYVTTVFNWDLRLYVTLSGYAFAIYYVFKSIVIYTSGRKKYLDSFSDISEIVKEQPQKKMAVKHKKGDE